MTRLIILCFVAIAMFASSALLAVESAVGSADFPTPLASYDDTETAALLPKLIGRVEKDPFNAIATVIFLAAIVHTFLAAKFRAIALGYEHEAAALLREENGGDSRQQKIDTVKFKEAVFHFLGEVEAIFGIWLIPLAGAIIATKGIDTAKAYINGVNFTEPIFVVVIMAIASSKPVLQFAEGALKKIAALGGGTPAAWWLAILTVGPLLGSFITEPAAITICAVLLAAKFYLLNPSLALRYATLGLLFVNVSVGGTLTHFAAPPVVMVAGRWDWDTMFMLTHFGWKATLAILLSNAVAFAMFRKELLAMSNPVSDQTKPRKSVPASIIGVHLCFIGFVVYAAHDAALVVLAFMFFLAFVAATERNQNPISLRGPVLVGFFLAGLVIHGGCQQWWIEPVLTSLNPLQLLLGSTILTAFNDNAAITYLASLVPGFSDSAKQAVVSGAVIGGGLTVIANAPNPAGQSILQCHFGPNGVDALKLFLGAAVPTLICLAVFLLTS